MAPGAPPPPGETPRGLAPVPVDRGGPPAIPDHLPVPAPPRVRTPDQPVLAHEDLRFAPGPDRETCWRRLPPAVARRVQQLAGESLAWWAEEVPAEDGRSRAHLLGTSGYAIAEPRIDTDHRRVYAISCFVLDPQSFRHVPLEHRPSPGADPASRSRQWAASGPAGGDRPPLPEDERIDLPSSRALSVLGALPGRAQRLLLEPFLAGERVLRSDVHYEGHPERLNRFVLVLAGSRTLTAASGDRVIPAGHDERTAHWSLVCRRATVSRRIGR